MAKKKTFTMVIKEEDIQKVRKKSAPPTQVIRDTTKYNRKRKHKKSHLDDQAGLFTYHCLAGQYKKRSFSLWLREKTYFTRCLTQAQA